MRKILFTVLISFFAINAFSQQKYDVIYYTSGKTAEVNITVNYEDKIEFTYPNEEMINVVSKQNLAKIEFKSGRVEELNAVQVPEEDPAFMRMMNIKAHKTSGSKKAFKGIKRINLSVTFSSDVAKKLKGNPSELASLYAQSFEKNDGVKLLTIEETEEAHAIITIVSADDDGEMYGVLDFFINGEEEPCYSIYLNGNGYRREGIFDERLHGGVINAAKLAMNYLK